MNLIEILRQLKHIIKKYYYLCSQCSIQTLCQFQHKLVGEDCCAVPRDKSHNSTHAIRHTNAAHEGWFDISRFNQSTDKKQKFQVARDNARENQQNLKNISDVPTCPYLYLPSTVYDPRYFEHAACRKDKDCHKGSFKGKTMVF